MRRLQVKINTTNTFKCIVKLTIEFVLSVVSAEGGGSLNPTVNSTLRSAIDLAIHNEVPKATITTALKKYTESADNANLRRHLFECRLYGKVFTVFAYYTANLAQTKIKINTALRKHNADQTRVKHIFTERGLINAVIRSNINETSMEDDCTTDAIECSANDVEIFDVTNRYVTFFCDADALPAVRMKLAKMGYQIENSDIVYEPSQTVSISKQEQLDYGKFKERLNSIEGFDDIFDNIANDEQHILG